MAEKKGGDTKKAISGTLSKTARRSMTDVKNVHPKAIAWAWEKGIKVGVGRKPDYYIFSNEDLAAFNQKEWIIIKAAGPWIGGSPTTGGKR